MGTKIRIVAESDAKAAENAVNAVIAEMDKEYDLNHIIPVTPAGTLGPWKFILYFTPKEVESENPLDAGAHEFMRPPIES